MRKTVAPDEAWCVWKWRGFPLENHDKPIGKWEFSEENDDPRDLGWHQWNWIFMTIYKDDFPIDLLKMLISHSSLWLDRRVISRDLPWNSIRLLMIKLLHFSTWNSIQKSPFSPWNSINIIQIFVFSWDAPGHGRTFLLQATQFQGRLRNLEEADNTAPNNRWGKTMDFSFLVGGIRYTLYRYIYI